VTWQPGPAISVFAAGLFEGTVALVTGGGTGLGREVAHAFARLGGQTVIAGRTADRLEEVAACIEAVGGSCLAVPTNIREPDEVEALRDAVYDRYGRVDFLVGLLAEHAEDLGEPYTRHLGGKVRELRFHLLRQQTRVSYWLAPGRRVILLTVFRKTRSTEIAEVARALRAQEICESTHGIAHEVLDREVT